MHLLELIYFCLQIVRLMWEIWVTFHSWFNFCFLTLKSSTFGVFHKRCHIKFWDFYLRLPAITYFPILFTQFITNLRTPFFPSKSVTSFRDDPIVIEMCKVQTVPVRIRLISERILENNIETFIFLIPRKHSQLTNYKRLKNCCTKCHRSYRINLVIIFQ